MMYRSILIKVNGKNKIKGKNMNKKPTLPKFSSSAELKKKGVQSPRTLRKKLMHDDWRWSYTKAGFKSFGLPCSNLLQVAV